jgi:hypothetical protein
MGAWHRQNGYPPDYDDPLWRTPNEASAHERGRQWATIAKRMRLKVKGKLNPKAVALFRDAVGIIR